ncbi:MULTISPECIES: hypothetical protein [Roseobacter]|uniref:Lipoprotein n=1 Tax=Roseobacter litoralis (strain ATCC 49566 / DSM 6996 / JCM 21268 / NBRC 15278 / OCh 149) TaxID=391595 RepID=F7ZCF1_ROSLO|nr:MULTISPECIES: hypothetical protein [Roseobacter]AEI93182.1 hypothetical protein RLO149_c011780 [Roseobacter litoralis Och 149]GIT85109.1 hypothetical protein ROBYS_01250 [Roseobacter sp. OBYS 0001]
MQIKAIAFVMAAGFSLAACGDSIGEQAVGGAAIGAGAAVITNNGLAKGAALGAGANVLFCQLSPGQCN